MERRRGGQGTSNYTINGTHGQMRPSPTRVVGVVSPRVSLCKGVTVLTMGDS